MDQVVNVFKHTCQENNWSRWHFSLTVEDLCRGACSCLVSSVSAFSRHAHCITLMENVPYQSSTQKSCALKKKKVKKEDYRPLALISIVLKCLERLVPRKLHDDIKDVLDLFQFTYKDKLATGYAVNTLVHLILKHLKQPKVYACMPFVDFSSAFNTIQPHVLLEKKKRKSTFSSLNGTILFWLADHNLFESTKPIPSPSLQTQGCVSSPLLYTNFTHWPVPFFT